MGIGIQGYQIWHYCVSNVKYTNMHIRKWQCSGKPENWHKRENHLPGAHSCQKKGNTRSCFNSGPSPQLIIVLVKFWPICYLAANSQGHLEHLSFGAQAPELWSLYLVKMFFCFNLKKRLQEYDFLFCDKCIFVSPIIPGFIGALPAWTSDTG